MLSGVGRQGPDEGLGSHRLEYFNSIMKLEILGEEPSRILGFRPRREEFSTSTGGGGSYWGRHR